MKTDIDGALAAQRVTDARPPLDKNTDTTFGIHRRQDGQLGMGSKAVRLGVNGKTLAVDDTEYKITSGLRALIALKHPRPSQWNSNDYKVYKSIVLPIHFWKDYDKSRCRSELIDSKLVVIVPGQNNA